MLVPCPERKDGAWAASPTSPTPRPRRHPGLAGRLPDLDQRGLRSFNGTYLNRSPVDTAVLVGLVAFALVTMDALSRGHRR